MKKHQIIAIILEAFLLPSLPIMLWLWFMGNIVLVGVVATGAIVYSLIGLYYMEKVKKEEENETIHQGN